jgi:hypothetical protein
LFKINVWVDKCLDSILWEWKLSFKMLYSNRICVYGNSRTYKLKHGEPPRKTVQPQSTWLWLSQLIRSVNYLIALVRMEHKGLWVAGV